MTERPRGRPPGVRAVAWMSLLVVCSCATADARPQDPPAAMPVQAQPGSRLEGAAPGAQEEAARRETLRARARALLAGQGARIAAGQVPEARKAIDEALSLFREAGDGQGEAVALILRGMTGIDAGARAEEAATADMEAALVKFEEAGDLYSASLDLWLLAQMDLMAGRYERAEGRLRQGLDHLATLRESPQSLSLDGFAVLGGALGAPVEILHQLGPMAEMMKPVLLAITEAILRDSLGGALTDLSRLDEAEAELERVAKVSGLFGGIFDFSVQMRLGDLRRRQWRLDEAKAHYEKALAGVKSFALLPFSKDGRMDVRVLGRLAEIELLGGRFAAALTWNDRALELVRSDRDRPREAQVLGDRAELYFQQGRLDESRQLREESLAVARSAKDALREAFALDGLGVIALMRGRYGETLARFEQAHGLYRRLGEDFLEAGALARLTALYQLLGAGDESEESFRRAHELSARSGFALASALLDAMAAAEGALREGGNRESSAAAFDQLGRLLADEPGIDGAAVAKLLAEAGRMGANPQEEEGDLPLPDLEALAGVGRVPALLYLARMVMAKRALLQGDLAAARKQFAAALAEVRRLGHEEGQAAALLSRAVVRFKEGDQPEAAEDAEAAVGALESAAADLHEEELLTAFLGAGRNLYYSLTVELLVREGREEEAFIYTERARARALLRQLGNQRLRPGPGADPELVARANALRSAMAEWERRLPSSREPEHTQIEEDLRHARAEYQDLLVRIEVSDPEYASLAAVQALPVSRITAELAEGSALVSYFITPWGVHAWVVRRDGVRHVSLPLEPQGLAEVACFARQIRHAPLGAARGVKALDGCDPPQGAAEALYRKLFAPLKPYLPGDKLILVPHGVLHYLPFAALRDPETGRFVVEDYTLTLAPSASVLGFLRAKESPVTGTALVMGEPATTDPGLPPLRGAGNEAKAVAALLGTEPLLGATATESRLYKLGGKVDLVHLAAHGVLDRESPRFSRIALAPDPPPEGSAPSTAGEAGSHDGNLEVNEIYGDLDLSGVNLVVLSACETALGEVTGGDEVVGLTRALLYAGSPGVISTLWNIDDEATAGLMTQFYQRLLSGETAAEALRGAQVASLQEPRYADPFYWAAFTLTGDPQGRWALAGRPAVECKQLEPEGVYPRSEGETPMRKGGSR
jgi:CHAT domain-containing protein/tetratricopeptide (TPR) repeat protein